MSYDWLSIETEYITSEISLREIAKKYDIPLATVSSKSKENKWVKKKKEYKNKIITKSLQIKEKTELKKLKKLQSCSDELDGLIEDFIKVNKNAKKALSAMDLSLLSKSLKDAVNIKRDVYNILTPAQEEKMQIEREKLELEKQKVKAGEIDKNITVILQGDTKEYAE